MSAIIKSEVPDGALEIELKDLYAANGSYTPEEKIEAVMAYMVTGTSRKASKICNIPEGTIRWWKSQAMWWEDVMRECRKKKQDELDAAFTNVIHIAVEALEDRVRNGNTVLTKDGGRVQVPMQGKEIAVSLAVIFDKRQLLRGDPTQKVERVTEKDRLDNLQRKFEEIARKVNAKEINDVSYDVVEEETKDGWSESE